jgi:crotonobetainyl-CoA:carnitine CoA-transferase CaiB-like acyl-CoA transferase
MQDVNQLPLAGVRVVDFGQQIAGPAVAMSLADLGATVIHIDPPTGPQWQHAANAVLNRNKHCIRIDLKTEQGLEQALSLIAKADIVIESFRPGVMKRLGIDLTLLTQQYPALIAISVPGFASNDQLRSQWKATEAIVNATSGVFMDMGFNRVLMGINPSFSPLSLGSSYAVSLASSAAVFALYQRQKSGLGDLIEVPVVAALMEGLSYNSYVIENLPARYKTMREQEITERRANNIELDLSYNQLQEYLDPFYRTYMCGDGRQFYCVCPSHRNHAKRALNVLGLYEELVKMGLPEVNDLYLPIDQWDGETSIGVYPLPKKWADIIAAKMKRAFLTKSAHEWAEIFGEARIPGAAQHTTQEWVNSEHCIASGLILEVEGTEYGKMKQPGPIAWLEECSDAMLKPKAMQNISYPQAFEMLANMEGSKDPLASSEVESLNNSSIDASLKPLWLEGVHILDLTNVIAGPHSCAYMARFGAKITKLDPVTPLYDPLIGTIYSFQSDMGKQKILADITSDQGREIFHRLICSVDIVVINATHMQLKELGLDKASLTAINKEVLFCSLDCYGGLKEGPKSNYIGYDDIIQADSGIMNRFGGEQTPEEHAHIGTLDVNCGFAAGLAMGVALYYKQKTGKVCRARTSLSAVTNFAQAAYSFDYQGRAPFNEPSGREALGNHSLSHFYRCSDDWLFLDAQNSELAKLESIKELAGISKTDNVKDFLNGKFVQSPAEFWVKKLQAIDIAVAVPNSIEQLRDQYSRIADNTAGTDRGSYAFSINLNHPSGHKVTQIDHYAIRPTRAKIKALTAAEKFGHSTHKILSQIGYTQNEIDTMQRDKVIANYWGEEYLPS